MKKVYLSATPAYHEEEDMIFKYAIYDENDQFVQGDVIYHDYRKPAVTGLYSVIELLKVLKAFRAEEIEIVVNDGALIEQIQGTTDTKNKDVIKVASFTRNKFNAFSSKIHIKSVAGQYEQTKIWEEKLSHI
jgi:hypothetical protein